MSNYSNRRKFFNRWDWFLVGLMLAFGGMLTTLSLMRYVGYNAGMLDLGNMSQAIESVMRGQPLVFTYLDGNMSRLALHVEWFYFLLAIPYALWPDPRLLLMIQAALFTLGAIPAYRLGARHVSPWAGRGIAALYLAYPVAQTAVLFDFHGDTLAMPLLLFALDALDRRSWRWYALWIILALSCKVYVAAAVAGLGFTVALFGARDQRRVGWYTLIGGVVYGAIAFFGIRPLFTTETTSSSQRGLAYLAFYFGQWESLSTTAFQRLISFIVMIGPALFLGWRAIPWLLPALPVLLAALLSTGPGNSFDYRYHHYAIVVPFLVMIVVMGLRQRTTQANPMLWRIDLGFTLVILLGFNMLFIDTPLNPRFWSGQPNWGLDSTVYGSTERDRFKDRFLAPYIADPSPIATSNFIAPRFSNRAILYNVRYPDDEPIEVKLARFALVERVIADALFDWRVPLNGGVAGGILYEQREIKALLEDPRFNLIDMGDGLLVFQRSENQPALSQTIEPLIRPTLASVPRQLGPLNLLEAEIESIGERRFRLLLTWELRETLNAEIAPVIVSQLVGLPNSRIVHLPSFALLPLQEWGNDVIREEFEIVFPPEFAVGTYQWALGVYDGNHPEGHETDARSQLGEPLIIAEIELR